MTHVRLKKCSVVVIVIMIEVEDAEEERMDLMDLAKLSLGRRVGISSEYALEELAFGRSRTGFFHRSNRVGLFSP